MLNEDIKTVDPIAWELMQSETQRQEEHLEMIASENFTSKAVMQAMGSTLTNKYAEGYPGKRYYSGCEVVDQAETLAIDRVKQLFGSQYANVQPHSGAQANMAVYFSVLNPGDSILAMNLAHGGHLTHGSPVNFSGKIYKIIPYGVNKDTQRIDYDEVEALALEHKPKMIVCGASAYARTIDFERFGQIAKKIDAYLLCDMAHISGLVATGEHPNPVPHCHFVSSTTQKSLRGPRGGLVLTQDEALAKKVNSAVFPGMQGGPMMHTILAKAVAFGQALKPEFKVYSQQVVKNAKALAEALLAKGYDLVSGGTDNHLILLNLTKQNLTGKQAEAALESIGIAVNKNMVPFDTQSPFVTSGIRIGTPALTSRGMQEEEMHLIADMIDKTLKNIDDAAVHAQLKSDIKQLCRQFPLYD
ncbi:MAG TPA: serine hydroxymethyltransferase [Oligoflexia bacterium]|nr:serine hydroxymethyltransferase [Oligoflexia bacterium]HMR24326.1 serine hydroxymethyltransferase [Oligoflexia bacterium]